MPFVTIPFAINNIIAGASTEGTRKCTAGGAYRPALASFTMLTNHPIFFFNFECLISY